MGGTFYEPTIVTGVSAEATLTQKEVFGPVLGVTSFQTEDDAIALANANRGDDNFGYRTEAVQLMRLAQSLSE